MSKKTETKEKDTTVKKVDGNNYFDVDTIKVTLNSVYDGIIDVQGLLDGRNKDVALTDSVTTTQFNQLDQLLNRISRFTETIGAKLDKVAVKLHREENKDAIASKRLEAKKIRLAKLQDEIAKLEKSVK